MTTGDTEHSLIDEFNAWCAAQGLPDMCAEELHHDLLGVETPRG